MLKRTPTEKAKDMEALLETMPMLLCEGHRNNDTINMLIVSYVLGFDWSYGFNIINKNVKNNWLSNDDVTEKADTYEEFVNYDIDRPYSRLEWVQNIMKNNPNDWKEILISKLM